MDFCQVFFALFRQRLIRAIGKSKAMELILTGDMLSAEEALKKPGGGGDEKFFLREFLKNTLKKAGTFYFD